MLEVDGLDSAPRRLVWPGVMVAGHQRDDLAARVCLRPAGMVRASVSVNVHSRWSVP